MDEIIKFLDKHYENAIRLVNAFNATKEKEWDSLLYLNELYVQVGHVYNVLYSNDNVNEEDRKIDNLGDELSDILLQLINLANVLDINMYDIKNMEDYSYDQLNGIPILLGQLTEVVMEMNGYRFGKERKGFDSHFDFAKDRIFKTFIITFNISKQYNLNMIKEFDDMIEDATGFLERFDNKLNSGGENNAKRGYVKRIKRN